MGADLKLLPFTLASSPRIKLVTVEQCWTIGEATRVSGPTKRYSLVALEPDIRGLLSGRASSSWV